MNTITMHVKEEIKKDVKELTRVAIEDGIAVNEIDTLYSYIHHNHTLDSIKQHLYYKIVVSDIIDRNIVSKRFVDKVIGVFRSTKKKS